MRPVQKEKRKQSPPPTTRPRTSSNHLPLHHHYRPTNPFLASSPALLALSKLALDPASTISARTGPPPFIELAGVVPTVLALVAPPFTTPSFAVSAPDPEADEPDELAELDAAFLVILFAAAIVLSKLPVLGLFFVVAVRRIEPPPSRSFVSLPTPFIPTPFTSLSRSLDPKTGIVALLSILFKNGLGKFSSSAKSYLGGGGNGTELFEFIVPFEPIALPFTDDDDDDEPAFDDTVPVFEACCTDADDDDEAFV
ncbi:hypothetical protein CC1G_04174 [Coprinopsis cinerea okayama7|uniref:Uncharacterized protein n=1 Tax=Coprinopsis cinerea (strain Okayama-7 / 130 / ATCC MYA-4618 / FGSC 9003) TaxID=240176 RepID=A8NW91_COPC7|nr:hypothetical protein CC1G_04174 [Coprinopsis cinerea okayama7\|eukprot:XP_001836861.1 hypothetical protein CC1G_04174 [Coprinopsis cinerea okayama7\